MLLEHWLARSTELGLSPGLMHSLAEQVPSPRLFLTVLFIVGAQRHHA